jgi:protein tyrosine/serine phosphatase
MWLIRINASRIFTFGASLKVLAARGVTQGDTRYQELPNFHKVNDRVYRGGQPKSGGWELLKQLGIKTIVNLRDDDVRAKQEEADARMAGLQYFNFPFERWGRPQDKEIERALSIIKDTAHQPVFVHCKDGADRTGVLIAIYRITHDGWTSQEAKAEAKRYGLKPWQRGMKDCIRDCYKRQTAPANVTHDR